MTGRRARVRGQVDDRANVGDFAGVGGGLEDLAERASQF